LFADTFKTIVGEGGRRCGETTNFILTRICIYTAVPLEDWLGEGRLQRLKGVRAAGAMMLC